MMGIDYLKEFIKSLPVNVHDNEVPLDEWVKEVADLKEVFLDGFICVCVFNNI
jgi:hypothetical protein